MNRALAFAAILLAIAGGYLLFKLIDRMQTTPESKEDAKVAIEITTATVDEETDTYVIDVQYPQFGIPAIDTKIKERIELSITQFKEDAAAGPPADSALQQYEFTSSFDSIYIGPDIISARIVASSYLGGAHGMSIVNGLNFERVSGRDLTPLDALALTGLTLEEVAGRAKAELAAKLGGDVIAPEGADAKSENYSTFVIDKDKVTFVFQVYQVGPYAAGPQEVSFERKK